MKATKIKDLKNGELFTMKPIELPNDNELYVRDEYERTTKRYYVHKYNAISKCKLIKGDTIVYQDWK